MDVKEFNHIIEGQINQCMTILGLKANEYATEDRLHNFRVAAAMQGITTRAALGGMMAKHTVSIYDMLADEAVHPLRVWEEKITDHINYLLLLTAILVEDHNATTPAPSQELQAL